VCARGLWRALNRCWGCHRTTQAAWGMNFAVCCTSCCLLLLGQAAAAACTTCTRLWRCLSLPHRFPINPHPAAGLAPAQGLLPKDELDMIVNDIRPIMKAAMPGVPDTWDNLYQFFLNRVRDNLHVILCFRWARCGTAAAGLRALSVTWDSFAQPAAPRWRHWHG
jgi:hypothetical protein